MSETDGIDGNIKFLLFSAGKNGNMSKTVHIFSNDLQDGELRILFEMGQIPKQDYPDSFNSLQDALEFAAYSCKQKFLRKVDICLMTDEDVTLSDARRFISIGSPQESMNILQTLTEKRIADFKRKAIELFFIRTELARVAKVVLDICKVFEVELNQEQMSPQDSETENESSASESEKETNEVELQCINLAASVREISQLGSDPEVKLSYVCRVCSPFS